MKQGRSPAKVIIYLELPAEKAGLKQVLEQLAKDHNRKLTGECVQALEEYVTRHKRWPPRANDEPSAE